MAYFLANEALKAYQRSGRLELVLWDHHGECAGPAHMRCWQPLVYSHAVLQAWGSGLRLLMIDIDEYFVLPRADSTLADALRGNCTGGQPMVRPAAQSSMRSTCTARPDSSAEARGPAGSSTRLPRADFSELTNVWPQPVPPAERVCMRRSLCRATMCTWDPRRAARCRREPPRRACGARTSAPRGPRRTRSRCTACRLRSPTRTARTWWTPSTWPRSRRAHARISSNSRWL